jgi:hypothetical protein
LRVSSVERGLLPRARGCGSGLEGVASLELELLVGAGRFLFRALCGDRSVLIWFGSS